MILTENTEEKPMLESCGLNHVSYEHSVFITAVVSRALAFVGVLGLGAILATWKAGGARGLWRA